MSHWDITTGLSDEWYTPKYIFDALGCYFDLDVAAPRGIKTFVPAGDKLSACSLETPWHGFVWMNPPYGGRNGLVPWLDKFFAHDCGLALVPDRTSAPWFQDAWQKADLVLFTARKVQFIRPDGSYGKQPSHGNALFAAGRLGVEALQCAHANGLGILARPAS